MFGAVSGTLYPTIGKPIYRQLHDIIIEMIESGELAPGDALPGERTLAEMYDVSRVTVRRCIGDLVGEGYLTRGQGKETRVAERKIDHHLGRLVGSVEEFLNDDYCTTIDVVSKGFVTGSPAVRRYLEIEGGTAPVYAFARRICGGGQPLAVNYSFVPQEIGKIVDSLDLTQARVFSALENAGFNLSYGKQTIMAAACMAEEAALLKYTAGQPVLVIRRTSYLEDGHPLLYEKTVYRGDNYQYSITLRRKL
jgi:GntR family transcriptional regulator